MPKPISGLASLVAGGRHPCCFLKMPHQAPSLLAPQANLGILGKLNKLRQACRVIPRHHSDHHVHSRAAIAGLDILELDRALHREPPRSCPPEVKKVSDSQRHAQRVPQCVAAQHLGVHHTKSLEIVGELIHHVKNGDAFDASRPPCPCLGGQHACQKLLERIAGRHNPSECSRLALERNFHTCLAQGADEQGSSQSLPRAQCGAFPSQMHLYLCLDLQHRCDCPWRVHRRNLAAHPPHVCKVPHDLPCVHLALLSCVNLCKRNVERRKRLLCRWHRPHLDPLSHRC
mmetsp:Transcript_40247/g.78872  ORF Transcript_40247/g.78872 Transcript_40247/m.78872 type:complete len:287 (-) Transcript_40247:452-1312(-)